MDVNGIYTVYPLGKLTVCYGKRPIEIDKIYLLTMVIVHRFFVCLLEGNQPSGVQLIPADDFVCW